MTQPKIVVSHSKWKLHPNILTFEVVSFYMEINEDDNPQLEFVMLMQMCLNINNQTIPKESWYVPWL
jgi:hypothetical protein